MHYEVELGLVMGKTVRDLDPEDTQGALDAIEGMLYFLSTGDILTQRDS
jgi:2-keto-4-pentenoate hydratase/2-oxohepta-3-ene-1,7-dioic acid hydratase in catechol pathway